MFRSRYRALPAGTVPTGGWLLFAYLKYAEELERLYAEDRQKKQEPAGRPLVVQEHPSAYPSAFARALASRLAAEHRTGSTVHWGNDGFCVDVALHHPDRADDVTIGVLCDLCRFGKIDDPIAWDVFRSGILRSQGWQLQRLWTPQFFRDPAGVTAALLAAARQVPDRDRNDRLAVLEEP